MRRTVETMILAVSAAVAVEVSATPVEELASRALGEKSAALRFESASAASYRAADGKIVVAGATEGDKALALGAYLRDVAGAHWSWCGSRWPDALPLPAAETPVKRVGEIAFAYNYCTLCYTFAYRGENFWRAEIDRLALYGFNRALVIAGLPKVWQLTLRELGMSEADIQAFIPDLAATAWWAMGNLEGTGGPVPEDVIERDAELGRFLVKEMRALGIEPVLQGFTGLLPNAMGREPEKYGLKGVRFFEQGLWGGLLRPIVMDPTDPAFARLAEVWYRNLFKVYGTDYSAAFAGDLFHEGGNSEGVDVTTAFKNVQAAQQQASRGAVWYVQAWGKNPTDAMVAGLDPKLTVVEKLVYDMSKGDRDERKWGELPVLWCELLNFGGNHGLYGGLDVAEKVPDGYGWGLLSEGLETNPWFYEEFTRHVTGGRGESAADYARRRWGTDDARLVEALGLLRRSVFNVPQQQEGTLECVYCAFPAWEIGSASTWGPKTGFYYDRADVRKARDLFEAVAKEKPELMQVETFVYDLTDVRRQVVSDRARELLPLVRTDAAARAEFLAGLVEMDRILSASPYFRLDHYLKLAAELDPAHGPEAVKRMYTTWVEPSGVKRTLDDYAHRQLAGLMDYYYGRWTQFFAVNPIPPCESAEK